MHRHGKLKENIIHSLSCSSSSATSTLGNGFLPFRAILDVTCSNIWKKQFEMSQCSLPLIEQSFRDPIIAPAKHRCWMLHVCFLGHGCRPKSSSRGGGFTDTSGGPTAIIRGPRSSTGTVTFLLSSCLLPHQPPLSRALIAQVTPSSEIFFPFAA